MNKPFSYFREPDRKVTVLHNGQWIVVHETLAQKWNRALRDLAYWALLLALSGIVFVATR